MNEYNYVVYNSAFKIGHRIVNDHVKLIIYYQWSIMFFDICDIAVVSIFGASDVGTLYLFV